MPTISREFKATPPQSAFIKSPAKIRGYGGAMGGGKSRAICEVALQNAIDFPGIQILICRQAHTSITETTKRTMTRFVIPPELLAVSKTKSSMGEDWIELPNGSRLNFVGLDNPVRWFSSEIGLVLFDEAHEIKESDAILLISRLRQQGMPHRALLAFNPADPGHWLYEWFYLGAERTKWGFRKPELKAKGALRAMGDAEFFFASARDNPHLPEGYVEQTLEGMPEPMRRRYLEGLWEFISGTCYFDSEALLYYEELCRKELPLLNGRTEGNAFQDMLFRTKRGAPPQDRLRFVKGDGPLAIWRPPIRRGTNRDGSRREAKRYVLAADVSSGGATDYSALQVVCVEDFEVVARFQGKLDPDLLAVEAYRLGRIYNDALIVPEVTGGWGFSVEQELKRLRYPNLYTKKVLDRLSRKWTDRTGWDTTVKTRAHMLDTLERVIRERELGLYDLATLSELGTFVRDDNGKPMAQPGRNDDLVISLAIAVTVAADQPKQLRRLREAEHKPQFAVTGY